LYALINSVVSLNCWVVLTEEAVNELTFWQKLPRLRFEGAIWPPTEGVAIRMASDASDIGWGGHTMQGAPEYAHEYFSEAESVESSTYRELLGVLRCLQPLMHLCADKFVVFQVDAKNLLGIVNRGSPRLKLNALAREMFWLGLEHRITLTVEWVPREQNTLADELSKLLIPEDFSLGKKTFSQLEGRWGVHSIDLFASNANNLCGRFYSLHWCRGTGGVNAFAYNWGGETAWIHCPYRMVGRVWRKLQHDEGVATMLIPLWESATWWRLVVPDAAHFAEAVVDWVWLPRADPDLFVPGTAPGRVIEPPDWPIMAVRIDFSVGGDRRRIPLRDRCVHGGCSACRCRTWHR
jgi:hypothetical protein